MINRIFVAFLFCLASTIANAEVYKVNRTIPCDKATEVFTLLPKYEESSVWQGKNSNNLITLLTINPKTGTWSLIITDGNQACLLDTGKGYAVQSIPEQENSKEPNL